jgi:hypothetical protein
MSLLLFWDDHAPCISLSSFQCLNQSSYSVICVSGGLKSREYGRKDSSRWRRGTLYPQTLALTSSTSGGHSVDIVRSRTQATEIRLDMCIIATEPISTAYFINPFNQSMRLCVCYHCYFKYNKKDAPEVVVIYSETCIRRNRMGPKIFSTLDKFPHYTK